MVLSRTRRRRLRRFLFGRPPSWPGWPLRRAVPAPGRPRPCPRRRRRRRNVVRTRRPRRLHPLPLRTRPWRKARRARRPSRSVTCRRTNPRHTPVGARPERSSPCRKKSSPSVLRTAIPCTRASASCSARR
ncbi:MAG: hypothetical protein CVU59_06075 [Deltaproteobacteria bacterium HGW-Deltaproteobacteria-17]|nr:MAG: hypothetical protein CVU59_06075 [Deltaproteobacteria bacterium HGW-Deltaproteobacteria-17]